MASRPWPPSHAPSNDSHIRNEDPFEVVTLNELQQGGLYIVKIKHVTIALFQGTDLSDPTRWSEAKYLPNNFDAYPAFDHAGNPSIQLWTQQLRSTIPPNWFSLFEEAKMTQKQWYGSDPSLIDSPYEQPAATEIPVETHIVETKKSEPKKEANETKKETNLLSKTANQTHITIHQSPTAPTVKIAKESPLWRLNETPKDTLKEIPKELHTKTTESTKTEVHLIEKAPLPRSSSLPDTPKKVTQRKSWSSFFLKRKKSKPSLIERTTATDTYPTLSERIEARERFDATTSQPPQPKISESFAKNTLETTEKPLLETRETETDALIDLRLALAFLDSTTIDGHTLTDFSQHKVTV
ncbi:hypothetical protein G6F56_002458 [Rhizopus delemar]|nr:hypothetical protein G6F56_002458 [Rhizopus delemar]